MSEGFFDIPDAKPSPQKILKGATGCNACGLYRTVQSPKIPYTGRGKLKAFVLGEAPGEQEDRLNNQFVGETGTYFRNCLRIEEFDLDRDFWKSNSLACRPMTEKGSNRPPTSKEIQCCEPNWRFAIQTLKPNFILLFGSKAVEAFFMHRTQPITTNLSINRWRNLCIPDSETGAWILPNYHPAFVIRNPDAGTVFKLDLKWALQQVVTRKPPEFEDYKKKIICITNFDDLCELLIRINGINLPLIFDYETSGLRPFFPGHHIWTISCSIWEEDVSYSFPYSYPGIWDSRQLEIIQRKWADILANPNIPKIAQNIQMEHPWSKIIIGQEPQGWCWDTMVCSHIIDERIGYTGLDFQTFIRFGYEYGSEISKYKNVVKGTKFNTVHKCPLPQLLEYGGLDSYFTNKIAVDQNNEMGENSRNNKQRGAYDLFLEGVLTFSDMEQVGISVDTNHYQDVGIQLDKRINFIKKGLLKTTEAKIFKEKTGREIKLTSPEDLKKLLFNYMGLSSTKKTAHDGDSVDKDVMEGLDIPFAKDLVKVRKLEKLKSTYIDAILDLQVDRKIHPEFNLHLPRTYRSSSCVAKGTLIEVARDVFKYPLGIPIENVVAGDFVYCYDNDLKPAIRKVIWAGKTGDKKVIRIHWQAGQGGRKRGYLDVTPEHLIRTINGEYLEAQNLLNGDLRGNNQSKYSPKFRVLAVGRTDGDDRIYFTGCPPILDHIITKIENLDQFTEVYDIQVEEFSNFIANEICVHNSNPNFQNLPKRDEESKKMVRGGIIPFNGNHILEADYGGHEVGIIACYSKDPVLMKERKDGVDIHEKWANFLKVSRFDGKNGFTFALFYGSYYKNIHLDLVSRGYHNLSQMRVREAEYEFWKKYRGVKKFQENLIKFYQEHGYIEMFHGFRRRGFLTRNEIVNTPIQGTAFHLLLWSCNRLGRIAKEEKWESKLIGQIHDSIVIDTHPNELQYVAETVKRVMTKDAEEAHPWIIVPLISEIGITDIDKPWYTKKDYVIN